MFELLLLKRKTSFFKNVGFGIMAGGYGGSSIGYIAQGYAYNYVTNAIASDTSLSVARNLPAATSNGTYGIFSGGGNTAGYSVVNDKYTFSSHSFAATTSLSAKRIAAAGLSNDQNAIISGGASAGTGTVYSSTVKYNYSSAVISAGSDISNSRMYLAAAGDATHGIFESGYRSGVTITTINAVDEYKYSNDSVTSGTASSVASAYGKAAAGNKEYAVFSGGSSTAQKLTELYTYATRIRATSSQLLTSMTRHFGHGNEAVAIFGNGGNTSRLSLANQSYTAGTSLGMSAVNDIMGTSSSPGWIE